jgi:hypothetical protein
LTSGAVLGLPDACGRGWIVQFARNFPLALGSLHRKSHNFNGATAGAVGTDQAGYYLGRRAVKKRNAERNEKGNLETNNGNQATRLPFIFCWPESTRVRGIRAFLEAGLMVGTAPAERTIIWEPFYLPSI